VRRIAVVLVCTPGKPERRNRHDPPGVQTITTAMLGCRYQGQSRPSPLPGGSRPFLQGRGNRPAQMQPSYTVVPQAPGDAETAQTHQAVLVPWRPSCNLNTPCFSARTHGTRVPERTQLQHPGTRHARTMPTASTYGPGFVSSFLMEVECNCIPPHEIDLIKMSTMV